mmetsp:Transcript_166166/g.533372  ORF Transcript_166166/g.533372 Transcript_166166/m.533372 type:complete len:326 (+) Transcript_166166:2361-3338(+)
MRRERGHAARGGALGDEGQAEEASLQGLRARHHQAGWGQAHRAERELLLGGAHRHDGHPPGRCQERALLPGRTAPRPQQRGTGRGSQADDSGLWSRQPRRLTPELRGPRQASQGGSATRRGSFGLPIRWLFLPRGLRSGEEDQEASRLLAVVLRGQKPGARHRAHAEQGSERGDPQELGGSHALRVRVQSHIPLPEHERREEGPAACGCRQQLNRPSWGRRWRLILRGAKDTIQKELQATCRTCSGPQRPSLRAEAVPTALLQRHCQQPARGRSHDERHARGAARCRGGHDEGRRLAQGGACKPGQGAALALREHDDLEVRADDD